MGTQDFEYLKNAVRGTGMEVKRCFDHDGNVIDSQYELRKGDYTRAVGTCDEIIQVLSENTPTDDERAD